MKIGIIGAGKVGTTLGQYLKLKGMEITGIYSNTLENARDSAEFIGTECYEKLEELVKVSNTLFLTVPDGAIELVWDCITEFDLNRKLVCHFSGSLSSDVFKSYERTGAKVCSVHPIYAFSNKYSAYEQFHKVRLTLEGEEEAVWVMKGLWEGLGHKVTALKKEDKAKYHAAMSLASNHVLAVLDTAIRLLKDCGFQEDGAYEALNTLVCENVANGMKYGVVQALTGPVERNDTDTVKKHLEVLNRQDRELYRNLAGRLIEISKIKNPERNYEAIEKVIGGNEQE